MEEIKIVELWMGLVNFLAKALLVFKDLTGSYGLAIIMLTVLVRVLMLPLTIKQTKAMKAMQHLQPEIKKIQQKHKNDKKKQQEEHLRLISEHGVNPLGGCLPLLLQMPMFFALYSVLRERGLAELKELAVSMPALAKVAGALGKASFLGISSLGMSMQGLVAKGAAFGALAPYGILIALMIGSQFLYSRAMGSSDKSQARMMYMMLIFMGYFSYIFPAGLIIYWVTTNVIGILEHYYLHKFQPQPKIAKQGASK